MRHESVKHWITENCRKGGMYAVEEMRVVPHNIEDDPEDHKSAGSVVDIVVFAPDATIAIDVSGTCPAAHTYRARAARTKLHAAKTRANFKRSRYERHCQAIHMKFLPLVFESTGALHSGFRGFVNMLADAQYRLHEWREDRRTCHSRLTAELNAIIHRGNADIFEQCLVESRAANRRGDPTESYQPRGTACRLRRNWASMSALVRGAARWNSRV